MSWWKSTKYFLFSRFLCFFFRALLKLLMVGFDKVANTPAFINFWLVIRCHPNICGNHLCVFFPPPVLGASSTLTSEPTHRRRTGGGEEVARSRSRRRVFFLSLVRNIYFPDKFRDKKNYIKDSLACWLGLYLTIEKNFSIVLKKERGSTTVGCFYRKEFVLLRLLLLQWVMTSGKFNLSIGIIFNVNSLSLFFLEKQHLFS